MTTRSGRRFTSLSTPTSSPPNQQRIVDDHDYNTMLDAPRTPASQGNVTPGRPYSTPPTPSPLTRRQPGRARLHGQPPQLPPGPSSSGLSADPHAEEAKRLAQRANIKAQLRAFGPPPVPDDVTYDAMGNPTNRWYTQEGYDRMLEYRKLKEALARTEPDDEQVPYPPDDVPSTDWPLYGQPYLAGDQQGWSPEAIERFRQAQAQASHRFAERQQLARAVANLPRDLPDPVQDPIIPTPRRIPEHDLERLTRLTRTPHS
jgi:hypothetical protein